MTKIPIIIHAWHYDPFSGGCIVLHKLCHMLREMGEEAYVWLSPFGQGQTNPKYNTPIANGKIDPKKCVVIYPEGVVGDPLSAKVVVRWILYTPGVPPRPPLQPGNIIVHYAPIFMPNADPDSMLCLFEVQEDKFTFNDNSQTRSGGCFINRKGGNRPRIPETTSCIEIPNTSPDTIIPIFRTKEIFYSYDLTTTTSLHAALCGCLSVVIPDPSLTADEYRRLMPMHKYGIAYGMSKEELDYARNTQHLVKDHLKAIEQEGYKQASILLSRLEKLRGQ